MNDKLLPCPFCGGEANFIENREHAYVWCSTCRSFGAAQHNDPPGRFDYSTAAIAAWNRRAQLQREKPDGWISVRDRLPTYEYVLLCVETLRYGKVTTFGRMTGNGKFTYKNYEWEDKITHWMPLPEPPKEDG